MGPRSCPSQRELFDKMVEEVEKYANLSARRSALDGSGLASAGHSEALATTLADWRRHTRSASAQASELMDADTAALFTQVARGIDTRLWFVETGQPAGTR